MTTYSHSSDIPVSCRTNLEALHVWTSSVLYSLYPNQKYKEEGNSDPVPTIQLAPVKLAYENDKNFLIIRTIIPMADNWLILQNKAWANALGLPNSVTITGNQLYTID